LDVKKTPEEIEKSRKKNIENCHALGSRNPMSKLTEMMVLEIKSLMNDGICDKELSISFDVSIPTINRIRTGKIWKHVIIQKEDNE
jgi:hypothetical protein